MKEILLTQGKVALVDDEDFELLNQYKWYAMKQKHTFYACRSGYDKETSTNKSPIRMHRFLLGVDSPDVLVDHKDLNGLNNQKLNLRSCSVQQNNCNKRKQTNTSSKYIGVYWVETLKKYRTKLTKNGITYHGGMWLNEEDAAIAYNTLALQHHGEFANLNIINNGVQEVNRY